MHSILSQHWHHVSAYEALQLLDSDAAAGLDVFDVRRRQARYGPNLLPTGGEGGDRYAASILLPGIGNPLLYALLAALAALLILGEYAAVALGVLALAARGLSEREIARQTGIPDGEIHLILNLTGKR